MSSPCADTCGGSHQPYCGSFTRFDDVREVQGRQVPHRWTLKPLDKEGHETRIELLEVGFDPEFGDSLFTRRNLEKGR